MVLGGIPTIKKPRSYINSNMRSFLLKGKRPIIKWGMLPEGIFFEGKVPEGYSLAVCPSDNFIVVDVDVHDGGENGFENIPDDIFEELEASLCYNTKSGGTHYWLKYTGNKPLANKASGKGIDLRTDRGYVVWYHDQDIRNVINEIKESSPKMNNWLESLFSYVN